MQEVDSRADDPEPEAIAGADIAETSADPAMSDELSDIPHPDDDESDGQSLQAVPDATAADRRAPDTRLIEAELLGSLPDLRAYARSLTRNRHDADDLVQDAVLRMLGSADRYQAGTNFKAWAFTILRNRFLNEFVAKRRLTQEMDEATLERVAVSARQGDGLELTDFQRIFHSLPEDHRSILALVAGSGMPYEDVARVLGCAVGTVKSRVHRARAALFALLEAENAGGGPAAEAGSIRETPRFHRSTTIEERRRQVG